MSFAPAGASVILEGGNFALVCRHNDADHLGTFGKESASAHSALRATARWPILHLGDATGTRSRCTGNSSHGTGLQLRILDNDVAANGSTNPHDEREQGV